MAARTFDAIAGPYLVEQDSPSMWSAYQSISFSPQFRHMSAEEIRVSDYSDPSKKFVPTENNSTAQSVVPFNPFSPFSRPGPMVATDDTATKTLFPSFLFSQSKTMATPSSTTTQQGPAVKSLFKPFKFCSVRDAPERYDKLGDDTITFLVGPAPHQKFIIHEGVLDTISNFVHLALQGESEQASERRIPMPDDDPATFSVYQQWLYTSKLLTLSNQTTSDIDPEYKVLVKAYILGEKLADQNFKDCIADALAEKIDDFKAFDTSITAINRFDISLTGLVFGGTPAGSPLRKLWLEIYFHFGKDEWLSSESPHESPDGDFLLEFGRYSMQRRRAGFSPPPGGGLFSGCTYHGHGDERCYRFSKRR